MCDPSSHQDVYVFSLIYRNRIHSQWMTHFHSKHSMGGLRMERYIQSDILIMLSTISVEFARWHFEVDTLFFFLIIISSLP